MTRPIEWFLITLQHVIRLKSLRRGLKVYPLVVAEQKRRREESEPPFEDLWTVQLKSFFWRLLHRWRTGYKAEVPVGDYYGLLQKLAVLAESSGCLDFFSSGFDVRLAGGTIVIGEMYAINGTSRGIYVHKRITPQSEWKVVYRTSWLMDDWQFIGPLRLITAGDCLPRPQAINNAFHAAINTDVH